MTQLLSLQPSARSLLTDEFVLGKQALLSEAEWQPHAADVEAQLDVSEFMAEVDAIVDRTAKHTPALDLIAAPRLHKALPLDRRTASEPGIWRYLAMVLRPSLIRHRWRTDKKTTGRARFWDYGARPDSNAFCRLWWIAELTRDADDYSLTTRVLPNYSLTTALFVRELAAHRPLIEAAVAVLGGAPGDLASEAIRLLQARLSVAMLEHHDKAELTALLREIRSSLEN